MKYLKFIILTLCLSQLFSCDPRVELDTTVFGDHAYLDNVLVFRNAEEEHELQEFFTDGLLTPGVRAISVSSPVAIDSLTATAIVNVPDGTDLTQIGIMFSHKSERIVPQGNAPIAGIRNDFSSGPYIYRLFSADGTERDWTVSFE